MKHLIFFFMIGTLVAVDNQINEQYPLSDDAISYYGKEYVGNANEINEYINNNNPYFSSQKVFQFDQMPCVTIDGIDSAKSSKTSLLHLNSVKNKNSSTFQYHDNIVTLCAHLDVRKINYKTTSVISQQSSEFTSNDLGLKTDGVFNCLEIDAERKTFLIGTGDGKIIEYNFDQTKWLQSINASPFIIEGLWLVKNNKILIYRTNGYLYFKNRLFDKPLVRIHLPNNFSKIYWDEKENKVLFSHAGARVTLIGNFMNTPLDNDCVVTIPKFYILGEGLSYHHVMFLKTLREIKRLITNSSTGATKDDKCKHYLAALITKDHANLFEPMVAAVLKNYLEYLWSMNFTQSC